MLTYRLKNIAIACALSICAIWVQAQGGQVVGQNSRTPISQDGGRFLQFENLVSINFLKDSTQTYTIEENKNLVLDKSTAFVYDVQGLEQYHVIKQFVDSRWVNSERVENKYNFDQLISEKQELKWDLQNEEWIQKSLFEYQYNSFNQPREVLEMVKNPTGWKNAIRTTWTYNQEQLMEVETIYLWVNEEATWLANSRTLFTYNDDDAIAIEVIQEWNDIIAEWENTLSREFKYNDEDLIISTTRSVWEVGVGWVKASVLALRYNAKGQLEEAERTNIENNETSADAQHSESASYSDEGYLDETVQSVWDEENGWEPYKKEIHFWSEHYNGSLSKNDNEIDCQFANPYLLGLPWFCENLKNNVIYTVEVFDMWGRSFYKGHFSNNATFRLSGNIPPGLYNVVIQGGLDRHTEKVLIRN